jgi:hypothetical protein
VTSAPLDSSSQFVSGLVYVFRREQGAWVEKANLSSSIQTLGPNLLGISLCISDDGSVIVAGCQHRTISRGVFTAPDTIRAAESNSSAGTAGGSMFVWKRVARDGTAWNLTALICPEMAWATSFELGSTLDCSGDGGVVVASAWQYGNRIATYTTSPVVQFMSETTSIDSGFVTLSQDGLTMIGQKFGANSSVSVFTRSVGSFIWTSAASFPVPDDNQDRWIWGSNTVR